MRRKFISFLFFLSFIIEIWKYKNIIPQYTFKKKDK